MIHLLQVPLAFGLVLKLSRNYTIIVRDMFFFILVSQDHSVEVKHRKFKAIFVLNAAYVLC